MNIKSLVLFCGITLTVFSVSAQAAVVPGSLPGSADSGRVRIEDKKPLEPSDIPNISVPSAPLQTNIPEAAKEIKLVLNKLTVTGVTAFPEKDIAKLYSEYLGKEITLDKVYLVADQITKKYRDEGYFLSMAYLPEQSTENGEVVIKVVEGYVGEVKLDHEVSSHYVMKSYIKNLTEKKPISSDALESFLLRINSLPGYTYRAVLSALENGQEGAVLLNLVPQEKSGNGYLSTDNYGSRFLGPHEASASYTGSFLPLQQYSVLGLTSLPTDELKYGMIGYDIVVARDLTLQLSGGITKAEPGYNLEMFEIESDSKFLSAKLNYQMVKQRDESLSFNLGIDSRNTDTDVLNTAFTRDRVRAVRAGLAYDSSDSWYGFNAASLTLSRGLDIFGASQEGELLLSRAEAEPDFTKAEFSVSRLQGINYDWSLFAAAAGQISSGSLFSSEEFGYGGQAFGRAYDSSEITGDHGLALSLEIRYAGLRDIGDGISLLPYAFYDNGFVWNEDTGSKNSEHGSSAGLGFRTELDFGLTSNIGVAWPLTRDISAPIYGNSPSSPRIFFQLGQSF